MKDSDADKLKAEIERLKDEYTDIAIDSHYGTVNANHVVDDLEQLLSFLSTLESEEPRTIFSQKVFEQYDREQFINACEEPVGEELEKAALEYETDNTIQTYDGGGLTPMAVVGLAEAFEAGANWQKQHDSELIEIAYNDGITIGKTKQKEQDEKEQADLFTIVALDADQRAKEQMMENYPKWRRIKAGERLPCPAYVWTIAYDNYPDCFEGRLMPNIQGVKVGRDTWYLPVDVIHNLPKED